MFRSMQTRISQRVLETQKRSYTRNFDNYRRLNGPGQGGQGAPFWLGAFHHGPLRSILERSGWMLFYFVPFEMAYLIYDFGFKRVDREMGPWVSDLPRYDGTEYDETERELRFQWATDGTLCQTPQELAERKTKTSLAAVARLRIDMKKERGQI
eukprot:Sspe_Gene.83455::Locus_54734_Transcript_1_2_Confidence_0.857_Length_536::g.83455::m.83455